MELTGRITADAHVNTLTDNREVTNFTIVMNERYTTKSGEKRDIPTFVKCAYWVSSKAAPYLKKGAIVSVYGRIGLDVYKNTEGEAQGRLTFHVHNITFVSKQPVKTQPAQEATTPTTKDDFPF